VVFGQAVEDDRRHREVLALKSIDVRMEREQTTKGWIINIYVSEKPTIRTIDYKGLNSVSVSDVLERYKKVKVPLTVDSPYDATKVIKAKVVLQQLLSEHGRQFATISVQVQQVPPASVSVALLERRHRPAGRGGRSARNAERSGDAEDTRAGVS